MAEFFYRTEDIKPEEVGKYFVETAKDREVVNALKARNPIVLAGSRGVGKSFLLRIAQSELENDFGTDRIFPVYVSFVRSTLLNTTDPQQFQHWMLAQICSRLARALHKMGLTPAMSKGLSILSGGTVGGVPGQATVIDDLVAKFEDSWKNPTAGIDVSALPPLEVFRDAIEDVCNDLRISRVIVLIDEAAHILLPEQQRQFFTLFRDLRSPYLSCKAAVYPGVTSYGDTFQPSHDATMMSLDRDILGKDYVSTMREIVEKQAESPMLVDLARHGANFSLLAYAASGNPRVLLKTLARAPKATANDTNTIIREYYRNDLWTEHSGLPEKYSGHRHLIDWGRKFIEDVVLPDLQQKNIQYLEQERKSTCFFWIHRDAPQPVKESLRLLAYSGIVMEHATGIRGTRDGVGTRFAVNLGALIAREGTPTTTGLPVATNLTPKRMSEFGANHKAYDTLMAAVPTFTEPAVGAVLNDQLQKPIAVLDITSWQRSKLAELGLATVRDVLLASETKLRTLSYVGEVRSRRMRNAALAAVFEYLSG